jgi:trehalose/maltose hydrolase-like predicted phosphorylase
VTAVLSPPPLTEDRPEYLPAYLSNGLIGLRVGRIPPLEGVAIVSGLAALHPIDEVEAFARGPYPIAGDIDVNGIAMSGARERAHFLEQRYDFSCGELTTRFAYCLDAARVDVETLTFCSRSLPPLVLHEQRVRVDRPCRLTLQAKLDPTGIAGRWVRREASGSAARSGVDGQMLWETHGAYSTCGAAYATQFEGDARAKRSVDERDETAPLTTSYGFDAVPGTTYVLRQLTSLIASSFHSEPHRQATRTVTVALQRGFEALREENRVEWEDLWKGRVLLVGAEPRWQSLADAAYYYLNASAHHASQFSTAMFGLAYWPNYHYYRGQVMWDIEAFAFPALLLTVPETAEALLRFRSDHLGAAMHNAAMHGYRGLQFPWAAGSRHGDEAIRTDAPIVLFEQHVSMAVALAFARYVHATGDEDFFRERAWPVLRGVAEWLQSRCERTPRGYEIKRTLGIAEQRTSPVDNAAYVNMAAAVTLAEAADAARRLQRRESEQWREMSTHMFVPRRGQVIQNHDHYEPDAEGIAGDTPEALAGFFPIGYRVDAAVERATIEFYLGRADRFVGRPMLSAPLGVYAAWIGDRARSARLFEQGFAEFFNEPFREVDEFSRTRFPDHPRCGPFMANLGGFLSACLYGLSGLELGAGEPQTWLRRPVVMPESWEGVEVARLQVRGREMGLRAMHGAQRAELG